MKKLFITLVFILISILNSSAQNFIYYPSNNSTIGTTNVSFKWNHINQVVRYRLNISTNSSMIPLTSSDSFINTSSANVILTPNTYYWQVSVDTGLGFNYHSYISSVSIVQPANYDSLSLWVKADNLTSLIGDSVLTWTDNSPKNYTINQITALKRPRLVQNTLNHLPSVYFDGVDDNLIGGNIDLGINLEYSYFVISKLEDLGNFRTMFSKGSNTTQSNVYIRAANTNRLQSIIDAEQKTGVIPITNTKYFVYSSIINLDSANTYVNKVLDYKYVPTVDLTGTNTSTFNIGSSGNTIYWKGHISEILIYKKKLTPTEKNNIENYLMDKYAPPINLGKDIVTCNSSIVLSAKNDGSYVSYLWNTGSTDSAITISTNGIYSVRVTDIFSRISYDTINVNFDNTVYSSLNISDTAVCVGTPLLLSAGLPHLKYLWSNGDTTNISTLYSGGIYWVKLTDCQNNVVSDTFSLVDVDLTYNLGSDTLVCLGSPVLLAPNSTRSVSYLWNTGAVTATLTAYNAGAYWCRIRDVSVGCLYTDTINISTDSFILKTYLGNDTSLCTGNSITLASGFNEVQTILWNTTDTTKIITVTGSGDYSFFAQDSIGCVQRDTINIRIKGNAPYVDFIVNNICSGDTLIPINLSNTLAPDSISSYVWDFGDGILDSTFSPIHYYDSTGLYTVSLVALSDSGCSNFNTHNVSYSSNPIARIGSLIACASSNVTLTDASIVPTGYTINSWNWNVNGTSSTNSSINYNFPNAGKYPIVLSVTTTGGCTDIYSDSFEVFPAINLDFTTTNVCIGDTTKFIDNTGSFSIVQREWIFGSGLGYAFNIANPKFIFPAVGSYQISYKAKNAIGCTDSIAKYITIYSLPNAYFIDSVACFNNIKTFADLSTSLDDTIVHWNWLIDTNHYSTRNVNHFTTNSNSYNAQLNVTTIHGCKDNFSRSISISTPPIADFSYTPNYGIAPLPVYFTNTSLGGISYMWYFNDSSNTTSTAVSPTYTYLQNNDYYITLVATNEDGCQDSMVQSISIKPSDLDLQIEDLKIYETYNSNGYTETKVGVRLINTGSRIITNAKIIARVENGNMVSEDWTGTLLPGQYQNYIFNSSFLNYNLSLNRYICIEALEVNDGSETNLSNNKVCKNNHSQGVTSDIYPVPSNSQVKFDVVLEEATEVSYSIHNELGQVILPIQAYAGVEGLNHFEINTNSLSNGQYFVVVKYFSDEERRKFQINR